MVMKMMMTTLIDFNSFETRACRTHGAQPCGLGLRLLLLHTSTVLLRLVLPIIKVLENPFPLLTITTTSPFVRPSVV